MSIFPGPIQNIDEIIQLEMLFTLDSCFLKMFCLVAQKDKAEQFLLFFVQPSCCLLKVLLFLAVTLPERVPDIISELLFWASQATVAWQHVGQDTQTISSSLACSV